MSKPGDYTREQLVDLLEFHQKGQAACQYKGIMNRMHSTAIRLILKELEEKDSEETSG